uniref:Uncharacterized protein n=1 Tax=Onchocerca volvulus TaxID=6282 RepID=A0A8R1TTD3_ONCVO
MYPNNDFLIDKFHAINQIFTRSFIYHLFEISRISGTLILMETKHDVVQKLMSDENGTSWEAFLALTLLGRNFKMTKTMDKYGGQDDMISWTK